MLVEVRDHDEKKHILIERYLEGNYEKFNNNKGFVKGHLNKITETLGDLGLEVIEEESDDDSKSEDDDDVSDSWVLDHDLSLYSNVADHMFPQAFSHYSFEKSNKALMVVDLQGVFEKRATGLASLFLLILQFTQRTESARVDIISVELTREGKE